MLYRGSKVVGVQSFGVYVEVGPGRQGLVHISELDLGQTNEVHVCSTLASGLLCSAVSSAPVPCIRVEHNDCKPIRYVCVISALTEGRAVSAIPIFFVFFSNSQLDRQHSP